MALNISGSYYAPEYDQRFDSEAQYMRYKEAQHYEELRRRQAFGMQQAGFFSSTTTTSTAQTAVKPKKADDGPLGFLHNSDNKILLTGEAT